MNRRSFLTVAAGALAFPTVAKAAGPSRGRLPRSYDPVDTSPYIHPDYLTAKDVDSKIWPAVRGINQSGWVWTLESCQGHGRGGWSECPLIRLCCRESDEDRMLGLLVRSAPVGNTDAGLQAQPPRERARVEVYRHVKAGLPGWFEARAKVYGPHGITVFDRFAEAVNAR